MTVEPGAVPPSAGAGAAGARRVPLTQVRARSGWRAWVPGWRAARRITQFGCLALFLYLMRATEYAGADVLPAPVNLFFRLDPLNAAAAMLAGRTFLMAFWPALILLLLTLVFGRFFCGWICPLGTLFDYFHRLVRPLARRTNLLLDRRIARGRTARYWLLVLVLLASVLGVPIVGYLDPFGLLVRSWAVVIDPMLFHVVNAGGNQIEGAPAWARDWLNSGNDYLHNHALPFRENVYALFGVTAGIFAALFALELVARRFWCRFLCPLGALLGLAGRWSLVRRLPGQECGKCSAASTCGTRCRMGAFDAVPAAVNDSAKPKAPKLIVESCNVCMDCVAECPTSIARFKFKKPRAAPAPVGMSRRGFLTAAAVGAAVPALVRVTGAAASPVGKLPVHLVRPPGAVGGQTLRSDADFLNLCIRCGECLKVCTTNGLQPAGPEAGLAGLFAPVLLPRQGYCEYACTLCGQVCPTGAIPLLSAPVKAKAVMGKAAFDRTRCLPWAKNEECLVCEEHCPTGEKAIKTDIVRVLVDGKVVELQRPYVMHERCIGCGICENKCPLDDAAGIRVFRAEAVPEEAPHMPPPKPDAAI